MMEITFEIGRMRAPSRHHTGGDKILAEFDVFMHLFKIEFCCIRQAPNGRVFTSIPGRDKPSITITARELTEAIRAEALAAWRETEGPWGGAGSRVADPAGTDVPAT